jgi:signal transduction histidine kinase
VDSLLAAVLLALAVLELVELCPCQRARFAGGLAGTVLVIVPVAWRRHAPFPVFLLIAAAGIVLNVVDLPSGITSVSGTLLALGTVVAHGTRREVIAAICVLVAGLAIVFGVRSEPVSPATLVYFLVILGAAALLGEQLRRRRDDALRALERAERIEREAVVRERTRLARELHDVVAHHVSAVVVQAGAGRHALRTEPDEASRALLAIEESGRAALQDLRRLLGVLRGLDAGADAPGLREVETLLGAVRRAGLPTTLEVGGAARRLPEAVDQAAYRVVQEALTNALRHGRRLGATVAVRYRPAEVVVEVTDRAATIPADEQPRPGYGLLGMRERVDLLGGELLAGPRPEGGFAVTARFPLRSSS